MGTANLCISIQHAYICKCYSAEEAISTLHSTHYIPLFRGKIRRRITRADASQNPYFFFFFFGFVVAFKCPKTCMISGDENNDGESN